MKFDIVRAWKDEAYRQTLDEQELENLPANPAGELSETELATVYGGTHPNGNALGVSAAASSKRVYTSSFTGACDLNFASLVIPILTLPHLLGFARCKRQICAAIN
ncbi:MAG TPA: mersacidin/lichenicidin family type 2 lantibiotic [Ktedonobacteraceae bacterium]